MALSKSESGTFRYQWLQTRAKPCPERGSLTRSVTTKISSDAALSATLNKHLMIDILVMVA